MTADSGSTVNDQILPDLAPSWPASERIGIMLQNWGEAPRILHHVLIMMVLKHQQARKDPNGKVDNEFYKHRGLVISGLSHSLQDPVEKSGQISLIVILMLLQAEVCGS